MYLSMQEYIILASISCAFSMTFPQRAELQRTTASPLREMDYDLVLCSRYLDHYKKPPRSNGSAHVQK
ncbi:hypothetical protein AB1N83_011888 [Pleurotus pulmonarius]